MGAADAARLAAETGVNYYGVHTTCEQAADVLAEFQDDNAIRAETCVHYTALNRSAHAEQANLPKLAPPLREPSDTDALFEHIRRGTLSVVSTDHAVYHEKYKRDVPWWDAPLGANSVQVSLPVFHDVAVNERGLSYPKLVELMCRNPARTFGLPQKGTIEPGTDADLVLFDSDREHTIDADENRSNSTYSIYDGRTVTGMPSATLLRGEVVARNGEVVADPGMGEFLERKLPNWGI
jgi:dihydropyrimidinase